MKIHIIGTVNGQENEGMRNIATHLGRSFTKAHTVEYSSLKDIMGIIRRSRTSDVTFLFSRAVGKAYAVARVAERFSKRLCVALVQPPHKEFVRHCRRRPLRCDYLTLWDEDAANLPLTADSRVLPLPIGIDSAKFSPVDSRRAAQLKEQYHLGDKKMILHVGHLSAGRGLQDFLHLDSSRYTMVVVASGLFEDPDTERKLEEHGVRIIKGFLPHVNELYQMADAYLFPTRSSEYVIRAPLSVMEALACGTPAVAYRQFHMPEQMGIMQGGGLLLVDDATAIAKRIEQAVDKKSNRSYLPDVPIWEEAATNLLNIIMEGRTL